MGTAAAGRNFGVAMSGDAIHARVGAHQPPGYVSGGSVRIPLGDRQTYFFGGLIMMCAPAVPGAISHGAPSLALVERPVDWGVAKGT